MARIQISNDPSGRIIVSFPYDPLLVEKAKSIDGRRWHPIEKHWSFPNTDGLIEKILKVFVNENVKIDPSLQANLPKTSSSDDRVGAYVNWRGGFLKGSGDLYLLSVKERFTSSLTLLRCSRRSKKLTI